MRTQLKSAALLTAAGWEVELTFCSLKMISKRVRNALMSLRIHKLLDAKSHTTKTYRLAVENNKNKFQGFDAVPEFPAGAYA